MRETSLFQFKSLRTSEAIWELGIKDRFKQLRITYRGWGEMFGAKNPEMYVDHLRQRHPDLPKGKPFSIKASDGKIQIAGSLDLLEGYRYAYLSSLPGAKIFLREFSDLSNALLEGKLEATTNEAYIYGDLAGLTKHSRKRTQKLRQLAQEQGISYQTAFRRVERVARGKPINGNTPGSRRYVQKKHREFYEVALRLRAEGATVAEIHAITGIPQKTLYRWFKQTAV